MQKVALVTGAAKGLGLYLCRALLKKGYRVIGQYRKHPEALIELEKNFSNFHRVYGCFDSLEQSQSFCKEVKAITTTLHLLVNNVGNFVKGEANSSNPESILELFQVNFLSALCITQAFLSHLKNEQGHIINIGYAGLESRKGDSFAFPYFLSKQNLLTFTKSLAKELIPWKVKVNMLSPGHLENTVVEVKSPSQLLYSRLCSFKEFSSALLYLLSDEAAYVTGQNLEVAGGVLL